MGELVEGGEVGREGREGEARCNLDLWKVEVRPDSVDNLRLLVALHIRGGTNLKLLITRHF